VPVHASTWWTGKTLTRIVHTSHDSLTKSSRRRQSAHSFRSQDSAKCRQRLLEREICKLSAFPPIQPRHDRPKHAEAQHTQADAAGPAWHLRVLGKQADGHRLAELGLQDLGEAVAAAAGVGGDGRGNGTVNLHYLTPAEMSQFVTGAHALGKKAVVTIKDNDQHLEAFSQNTAPEVIEAFVSNIKAFVISNAYDGVDIDWEAKVTVGPYVNLLSRLRHALGEAKLITLAVGNWSQLDSVAAQAQAQVDHINVMCYDMDDTRSYAWHNAALLQNGDQDKMTCDWRVRAFTQAGVSRDKVGIGIPFYGRRWTGVTEPVQLNGSRSAGWVNYRDLVTDDRRWQPAHQKWDSRHCTDYLSIPALHEFDSFNGVRSIDEICRWARAEGFGGFMSFELSNEYLPAQTGDARYPLSTALWQAAHGGTPPDPQRP